MRVEERDFIPSRTNSRGGTARQWARGGRAGHAPPRVRIPIHPHAAQAVAKWLAAHPRFELIKLPTYCPEANPIERAFGDVHDKCTRNHKRTKITQLVGDVERHLEKNGPWKYKLSKIYFEPEVTAALENNAGAIPEEKSA